MANHLIFEKDPRFGSFISQMDDDEDTWEIAIPKDRKEVMMPDTNTRIRVESGKSLIATWVEVNDWELGEAELVMSFDDKGIGRLYLIFSLPTKTEKVLLADIIAYVLDRQFGSFN